MTDTAARVFEALVCDESLTSELGGEGAWPDIFDGEPALTPAFT